MPLVRSTETVNTHPWKLSTFERSLTFTTEMEKPCCSHKRHDSGAAPSPVLMDHSTITNLAESAFPEPLYGNVTWQTLLSRPDTVTDSMCAGLATCPPKGFLALHQHTQAEIYYILSGTGSVEIDGKRHAVSGGSILWIPGDAVHGVFCGPGETLHWLYIFPEARFEDVVYRFQEPIKSKL